MLFGGIRNKHNFLGHREGRHYSEVYGLVRKDCQLIIQKYSLFVRDNRSFLDGAMLSGCYTLSKYGDGVGVTSDNHNWHLGRVAVVKRESTIDDHELLFLFISLIRAMFALCMHDVS